MTASTKPFGVNGRESAWMVPLPADLVGQLLGTGLGRQMMSETGGDASACVQCLVERAASLFVVREGWKGCAA